MAVCRSWNHDLFRFPVRVVVDGVDNPEEHTESTKAENDDFFSTWDKAPEHKPAPTPSAAQPPVISKPTVPRTVTSNSLQAGNLFQNGGSAKPDIRRTSSSIAATSSTTSTTKKSKLGGLGAKKAAAPINFAEAERKAAEDAERIKKLGYDRQREEEESRAKEAEMAAQEHSKRKTTDASTPPKLAMVSGNVDIHQGSSQDLERLGMGFRRLGFGAVPSVTSTSGGNSTYVSRPDSAHYLDCAFHLISPMEDKSEATSAMERFKNHKAISSDMFFGKNEYDPATTAESHSRLQDFQGATSISSDQYFGREEEHRGGLGDSGLLGDSSLANIENIARDAIAKVMAHPEVQNVGESIRTGALKVCLQLSVQPQHSP